MRASVSPARLVVHVTMPTVGMAVLSGGHGRDRARHRRAHAGAAARAATPHSTPLVPPLPPPPALPLAPAIPAPPPGSPPAAPPVLVLPASAPAPAAPPVALPPVADPAAPLTPPVPPAPPVVAAPLPPEPNGSLAASPQAMAPAIKTALGNEPGDLSHWELEVPLRALEQARETALRESERATCSLEKRSAHAWIGFRTMSGARRAGGARVLAGAPPALAWSSHFRPIFVAEVARLGLER